MRVLRGIWRAGGRFDRWHRKQTLGVRALFGAVFWTLGWVVIALVRPSPHDRWGLALFFLAVSAVIALGIVANRLRKRRRVSLEK